MVILDFQTLMWPRLKLAADGRESSICEVREPPYGQLLPYEPAHQTGGLTYAAEEGIPPWT